MRKIALALVLVLLFVAGCGVNDKALNNKEANPQAEKQASSTQLISEDNVKQMILTLVQGASEKDIRKFKKDFDDGKWEYDIEVVYNKMEYEFEINAETGEIISWDSEPLYD